MIADAEQVIQASAVRFEEIESTVSQALELAADCETAYRLAPPHIKRRFNQAFIERVFLDKHDVASAPLTAPFAALNARAAAQQAFAPGSVLARVASTADPGPVFSGRGSNNGSLVVLGGRYSNSLEQLRRLISQLEMP